jgi:hypothetical protein
MRPLRIPLEFETKKYRKIIEDFFKKETAVKKGSPLHWKYGWILMALLLIISLTPTACSRTAGAAGKVLIVDNLVTASAIKTINGQKDWRNYTQMKNFPSGYNGDFFVVFSYSNALHNGTINTKGNIYIVSNGVSVDQKIRDVYLTESTDNQLFWGDSFDISKYTDGTYTVVVTITDLLSGASASIKNTFTVGETTK